MQIMEFHPSALGNFLAKKRVVVLLHWIGLKKVKGVEKKKSFTLFPHTGLISDYYLIIMKLIPHSLLDVRRKKCVFFFI